ncbi:MAG: hypothetical protein EBY22_17245 [Gammaproteobacteria bacterium]|nr:hypothetical protein [Gammaproteobacteria bacterium]
MEEGERPKTSADKYDQFLADKGYYKSMGYKNLKGEMVPDDLKKAAMEYASGQSKAEETPTQNTSGTTTEEAAQARSDFAKTDPRMVQPLKPKQLLVPVQIWLEQQTKIII